MWNFKSSRCEFHQRSDNLFIDEEILQDASKQTISVLRSSCEEQQRQVEDLLKKIPFLYKALFWAVREV